MDGIKVRDVADVSFAAPDLALMRSFLEDFGMSVASESGEDVLYMGAAGAKPFVHCTRLSPCGSRRPRCAPAKSWPSASTTPTIAESGAEMPPHQVWFSKAVTAVNGPFDPIQLPQVALHSDYEAEMVAVTGTGERHVPREAAPAAVFGWCVGNGVTERAWQHRAPQWMLGKSFDSHAPFRLWITIADEVPDPHALGIRGLVNGELRQSSNTSHLALDVWSQVEHLSQAMTLEPGDLLFAGTPGGVGPAMKPMRFPGDRVCIEIGGLSAIKNVCEPET